MKNIIFKNYKKFFNYSFKTLLFIIFLKLDLNLNNKLKSLKYKNNIKEIQNFARENFIKNVLNKKSIFHKLFIPKISVIITVYNGEVFLKPILQSIQRQKFLDFEIIIVDDCSKDNSINLIKEFMKNEPRIKLLINNENKGQFHNKMKAVLKAKGEYILFLDQDNYYTSKYAFSILYEESKKNDLDLLGFSSIVAGFINITISSDLTIGEYLNYIETPIIYKPYIKERYLNPKLTKAESSTSSCLYLIKRELFLEVINLLGDEFFNRNIDQHEDSIFIYLLSRNARNLKHIKRIFHTVFAWPESPNLKLHDVLKRKKREDSKCYSFLTYIRALLLFTENNDEDKEIASINLFHLFLNNNQCRNNTSINIVNESKNLCNLFLNNTYIKNDIKNKIRLYLNEINNKIINIKIFKHI